MGFEIILFSQKFIFTANNVEGASFEVRENFDLFRFSSFHFRG